MAKILYALSGEGYGHATRTKVILDALSKFNKLNDNNNKSDNHEIKIICGGKAYQYLSEHYKDIIKIQSMHIKYKNNKVSGLGTFLLNLKTLPEQVNSYFIIKKAIKSFRPDVIINDFENLSAYAAMFNNIPLISIGNHHVISNAEHKISQKYLWVLFKSLVVIRYFNPKIDYHYITSFFFPKFKNKYSSNSGYLPILIREDIKKLKPTIKKNHVLVYQTSKTNQKLFDVLKKFKKIFIIYGFNIDKEEGNLQFKQFNEKEFYNDLSGCEAVIANGGYSLMSEALYLKKPYLAEPIKEQFEQILNAIYLQKKGYGMFVENLDERHIKEFFLRLDKYRKNMNMIDNKKIDKEFYDSIKRINMKIRELSR
ncbi:MAG: MJ1255/VC2487 family glycosyltransferase [Candidatus Woesearchaeota archaeon]